MAEAGLGDGGSEFCSETILASVCGAGAILEVLRRLQKVLCHMSWQLMYVILQGLLLGSTTADWGSGVQLNGQPLSVSVWALLCCRTNAHIYPWPSQENLQSVPDPQGHQMHVQQNLRL